MPRLLALIEQELAAGDRDTARAYLDVLRQLAPDLAEIAPLTSRCRK